MRLVQTGNVGVAEYLDKPNNKKWISEDTFDRLHCEEVLPGDILISRLPEPAGRACIMPLLGAKMITAVDCTIVRTAPDMSNKFLVQYLSSQAYFDDVNICLAGGTRQRISRGNLANFDVPIPVKKSEQDAIGMFFGYLDNLITLHQRQPFLHSTPEISLTVQLIHPFYTSSWEQRKAIDIADYSKGNGYSKGDLTDAGTPIILYGRLYTKYQFAINEVDTFAVPRNGAVYSQGNEVIVPASGETAEDIARASAVEKSGVLLGGDLNILRPFDFINPLFLALAISNGEPQKELAKKAQGKSVVHIHNSDIQEVTIAYPSRTEQDRIVSYFSQLDNLITLHQRECISFTGRAGRLILSANKKRTTSSWEQRKLEDYLTVSTEKNTGNIYGRSDVLSVSGDYGIVNQIEFQGRSFAGASVLNYGVVQTGDVVYTKSPLNSNPYGIIKTNKGKPGIVSTLYAVYHPKENTFSNFIQVYFEQHSRMNNYMHPLVNKGAKNDMKVSAENALKGPVCFPSRVEQESISAFFSVLDHLITLHQRKPFLMKWRTSDANRNQTNRLVL